MSPDFQHFIGSGLVLRLLDEMSSGTVIRFDNMNDYYDPKLKEYRLSLIEQKAEKSNVKHVFVQTSIADRQMVRQVFDEYRPSVPRYLCH